MSGAAQYSGDKLRSPLVRRLLERTSLEADAEFTAGRPRVTGGGLRVTMADGTVHLRRQPIPPGHADNPLSAAQISAKFNRQTALLFSAERVAAIEAAVMGLDDCSNVSELTALLAAG
jgi:2-methylcitrate dehydratase PrpD